MSTRYFALIREMKDHTYNHRLRLVESAKQRGIKPTARLFVTTVPTVRKWLRRFQQHGPSGLLARPRARHHQPHKTPPVLEARLVELRKTLPTFGARRLIREFDLPIGQDALQRIWREHRLIQKRRRKYQRKQDLAHIKAQWALFQQISADTKDLDDIPRYWLQAQRLQLPVVQYTARDVRSGLLFWAFAEGRSASASAVFASRMQQHLDRYGVSLRDLVCQTDNGGEFKGDFPKALGDSQHVRILPSAYTYQSDVETVHRSAMGSRMARSRDSWAPGLRFGMRLQQCGAFLQPSEAHSADIVRRPTWQPRPSASPQRRAAVFSWKLPSLRTCSLLLI